MTTAAPVVFAAAFAALFAAHQVADHWIQTDAQARDKGLPGWRGRLADARHVATYTLTALAALALIAWRLGLDLDPARVAAGLAVSAVTHWWADRRHTLKALAARTGKANFYALADHGINGAYLLDQSFHIGALFVAALLIA